MSTIGVVSSVDLGPWRLPQRAQTALIQSWAGQNGLIIDMIVSEFVVTRQYPQLVQAVTANSGAEAVNVIFATGYQLPIEPQARAELLTALSGCELIFALEGERFHLEPGQKDIPAALRDFLNGLDHIRTLPILNPEEARTLAPLPRGETNVTA
ncbi:hypothetical protein [Azospirillum sp. Sh1]|uniref:hypothetical protein n=1 Tax=Azospirillum sp. Sh1 TaxID=2607285 RepID=UPI0011EEC6A7|nr:hypothetical protein [Azospirillum sp. Sh1]KAA0579304.1 hypothetical protein FZ029_07675 [Azospirillum sp. Sh1]